MEERSEWTIPSAVALVRRLQADIWGKRVNILVTEVTTVIRETVGTVILKMITEAEWVKQTIKAIDNPL